MTCELIVIKNLVDSWGDLHRENYFLQPPKLRILGTGNKIWRSLQAAIAFHRPADENDVVK